MLFFLYPLQIFRLPLHRFYHGCIQETLHHSLAAANRRWALVESGIRTAALSFMMHDLVSMQLPTRFVFSFVFSQPILFCLAFPMARVSAPSLGRLESQLIRTKNFLKSYLLLPCLVLSIYKDRAWTNNHKFATPVEALIGRKASSCFEAPC